MTTDSELFKEKAERLYGPNWRSRLAEDAGKDRATVNRWASGKLRLPAWAWFVLWAKETIEEVKQ